MKFILGLALTLFSSLLAAIQINEQDWLLWYKTETELPFSSSLTIYPPVNLYSENGKLKGSIATPYSFKGKNNRIITEFFISVIDSSGRSHLLKPKLESVGFVDDYGIGMSSLSSDSFSKGNVIIQLYKANTLANKKALAERNTNNIERNKGIEKALTYVDFPTPEQNKKWDINALTTDSININDIITSSEWTIFQLYSPYCGFCRKAIPLINALHQKESISVVGMAGIENSTDFKKHLKDNNVNYPFITYESEYAEEALLEAAGQDGFPTYIILTRDKKINTILIGSASLEKWLSNLI